MPVIRLQKILSGAGVASRRAAEALITAGRVTVNGQTIRELGSRADDVQDDVRVDGVRLKPPRQRYILMNKPRGFVTTRSDPQGRPTILALLGEVAEYVYPVGRLDYDSEGLLLVTNDGPLTAVLTHPRHGVVKVYEANVAGIPTAAALDRLRAGVPIDGRRTAPAAIRVIRALTRGARPVALLELGLREGRQRQVRKMCDAVGHPVLQLRRVRIGPIADAKLKPGMWRELTPREVRALWSAAGPQGASATKRPSRTAAGSERSPDRARDRARRG